MEAIGCQVIWYSENSQKKRAAPIIKGISSLFLKQDKKKLGLQRHLGIFKNEGTKPIPVDRFIGIFFHEFRVIPK